MPRTEIERVYGRPSYPGLGDESAHYRVHGGILFIGYRARCDSYGRCRGRLYEVSTDSRRYRTRVGSGVGARIPFGPCTGKPDYTQRRRGYRLGRHPGTGVPVWWRWAAFRGRPVTAYLAVKGAGDAPYRPIGVGVVFELGFIDGRVPVSQWRPTVIPDSC